MHRSLKDEEDDDGDPIPPNEGWMRQSNASTPEVHSQDSQAQQVSPAPATLEEDDGIVQERSFTELNRLAKLAEEIECWKNLTKHKAAISIQKMTRQRIANKVRDQLIFENISAMRIQSAWRWRYRDALFRLRS